MKKSALKKRSPRKKHSKKGDVFWFKTLLVGLLSLLILLVWVGSSKNAASQLMNILPTTTHANALPEEDISQVITPLLENDTFTLTFEDELPDPVFKDDKAAEESPPPANIGKRHVLGLIIDDVGYSIKAIRRLVQLPFTISVAILPDSPRAAESARMAHQHGLTVMLHMPMQTSNPKYQQKMEQFYLHQDMDKKEFTDVFEAALAKVPHVQGVNNHMGSLLTENRQSMLWMMELCKKHGLFFIDSRTSSKSVAGQTAEQAEIKWNVRDVFLDHSVEQEALQHAWDSALNCVKSSDHCIVLAHPHPETLDFLESQMQGLNTQSFVAINQILKN